MTPEAHPAYIVGLGASAGGLDALRQFFEHIPADCGLAFVVVQHLSPDFKSVMDELLTRLTPLTVVKVQQPTSIAKNCIYLLPPSKEMVVADNKLVLVERMADTHVHLPISRFFVSLAEAFGPRAVAIVLSGTGSDGSTGIAAVQAAGGAVFVQSRESAKFDGMPRSAIATGLADAVLSPKDLASHLLQYVLDPSAKSPVNEASDTAAQTPGLFERIKRRHVVDFSAYKTTTTLRRIFRRMEARACASLADYVALCDHEEAELDHLFRDLLISVTSFFRDEDVFASLRDDLIPELVRKTPAGEELRVWVAACASGEEAYSIAMLLLLEIERQGNQRALRVFATDAHSESLRAASEGFYTEQDLTPVPTPLRKRFFTPELGGRFRVSSELRKSVLFSVHNFLSDVPFNRIDLVSCRNVLIYLSPDAQNQALTTFHFSLRPDGMLLLGQSETVGTMEASFETIDRAVHVSRKVGRVPPSPYKLLAPQRTLPGMRRVSPTDERLMNTYEQLLARFVPASILVNEQREQLHIFGHANRYLRPAQGRTTLDIVSMCEGDLKIAVASALADAARRQERVLVHGVQAHSATGVVTLDVAAEPIGGSDTHRYLVSFFDTQTTASATQQPQALDGALRARFQQMEDELRQTRAQMQAMLEELETTNEELQASNEELQAGNEELQSTNEELQSVNEELYSVNAEYNQKMIELAAISADLRNLMGVTLDGVIFTDEKFVLRLFTPGAAQVLNLLPQDLGRPISHITSHVDGDNLVASLAAVQATRKAQEHTVQLPDGRLFSRRILPYEGDERRRSGLVITFSDVTERMRIQRAEDEQRRLMKSLIDASASHTAVIDAQGTIIATNLAWDSFGIENGGVSGRSLIGTNYLKGCEVEGESESDASRLVKNVLRGKIDRGDIDYPCEGPSGIRWFWMNVVPMQINGQRGAIIADTEITQRKLHEKLEKKLQESAKLESLGVLAGGIAHDFNNLLTGILANVSYVAARVAAQAEIVAPLEDASQAARRASELCGQMLAFSGRGHFIMKRVDLSAIVRETLSLIRASISKHVDVELVLSSTPTWVEVDVAQIQQVVMNLCINAAEAMASKRGVLKLSTSFSTPLTKGEEAEIVEATDASKPHACLEVEDNGAGMTPDLRQRIFEPFFTTKFTGRGLGLAAAQGIMKGHGGALFVSSTAGVGTRFRIFLPATDAPLELTPVDRTPMALPSGDGLSVLVIDDEASVLRLWKRTLLQHGYACVLADGGREGLALFRNAKVKFDLVILDLTMPDMDGVSTLEALRQFDPSIAVLLVSGFSENDATGRFSLTHPNSFLQKPFEMKSAMAAVQTALQSAASTIASRA